MCKTARGAGGGWEAITGLYEKTPAVDMFKKDGTSCGVAKSAAGIRKAVPLMAGFCQKAADG